ncbi:MAG: hypothetical protein R3F43_32310 [bacterium]
MLLSDEAKAMGAPPHWLACIGGTPDIDATIAQIRAMDGKVYVTRLRHANVGASPWWRTPGGAGVRPLPPESGGGSGCGPGGGRGSPGTS